MDKTQQIHLTNTIQKKRKNGHWLFYMDSSFKRCTKDSAHYYGFEFFDNGKSTNNPLGRIAKKDSMVYKPDTSISFQRQPVMLNGELLTYTKNRKKLVLSTSESFRNGKPSVTKAYYQSSMDTTIETEIFYFDSLYQNQPGTFLYYSIYNNIPIHKHYFGRKGQLTPKTYFVNATEHHYQYRPILGYFGTISRLPDSTLKPKDFLEIGFSKKYIRRAEIDTLQKVLYDNLGNFKALHASLLGSYTKHKICMGQKISCSYTLFFLKAEAGLINYTNFKQYDTRFIAGLGFDLLNIFTCMFQFSQPLIGTPFKDIGMFTAMIAIN